MKKQHYLLAFAILPFAWSSLAHGGGFKVWNIDSRNQGNRNAGAAAAADGPSTVFFNPAGLVLLDRAQTEFGVHLIAPGFRFKDSGSTNALGGPAVGDGVANSSSTAVSPTAFYSRPLDQDTAFGLGITTPVVLSTEYDSNWVGRYHSLKSDMLSVDINPAIGYRVSEKLSVGFGISAQYVDVTLTNALDFGTAGFLAGVPGYLPGDPAFDGYNEVSGSNWAFGYNLGLLYQVSPATRLGIGYRSAIDHKVKGRNRVTPPASLASLGIFSFSQSATAEVTVPATAELALHQQLSDRLTLLAGVAWTDWSTFDELRIELENGIDSVQPQNWQDAWIYSLGFNYRYDDQWTLRAGIQYDETPAPKEFRNPRIPSNDNFLTAVGFTYRFDRRLAVDFAYTHGFIGDYSVDDTEGATAALSGAPVGHNLKGRFESTVDVVSLQLHWSFD